MWKKALIALFFVLVAAASFDWGYTQSVKNTNQESYNSGYRAGYNTGTEEGYDSGHNDGYDEGYEVGLDEGGKYDADQAEQKGYEEGFGDGLYYVEDEYGEIFDEGYDEGYSEGYEIGYEQGFNDAEVGNQYQESYWDEPISYSGSNNNSDYNTGELVKIVFITEHGEKYHTYDCRYLYDGGRQVTLEYAKSNGYTPCSKCSPWS